MKIVIEMLLVLSPKELSADLEGSGEFESRLQAGPRQGTRHSAAYKQSLLILSRDVNPECTNLQVGTEDGVLVRRCGALGRERSLQQMAKGTGFWVALP